MNKIAILGILLMLFILSCAPPSDMTIGKMPVLRIWIRDCKNIATVSSDSLFIKNGKNKIFVGNKIWKVYAKNNKIYVESGKSKVKNLGGSVLFVSNSVIRVNDRRYRGDIKISANGNDIIVLNIIDMENYLKGVVPAEIGVRSREEMSAMEAQAVAARTYAYSHIFPDRFYDMENTVNDQVYIGYSIENDITNEAVEKTKGIVAMYKGKPIDAKYHSTCGGVTSSAKDEWGSNVPYLQPVEDKDKNGYFCSFSPHFHWKHVFKRDYFFRIVKDGIKRLKGRDPGQLKRILLKKHKGRVFEMTVVTTNGEYVFKGLSIRKVFSPVNAPGDMLRSRYFSIISEGENIIIDGHGFGHGVGMCQYGAMGMAKRGYKYDEILKHYYKGISLVKIP